MATVKIGVACLPNELYIACVNEFANIKECSPMCCMCLNLPDDNHVGEEHEIFYL